MSYKRSQAVEIVQITDTHLASLIDTVCQDLSSTISANKF